MPARSASKGCPCWRCGLVKELLRVVGFLEVVFDKGEQEDWFGSRFIVTLAILAVVALSILGAKDPDQPEA